MITINKSVIKTLTVISISLALFSTGCSSEIQKTKIQTSLQDAAREAALGRSDKAKILIDRAVNIDPKSIDTYVPEEENGGFQIPTNSIVSILVDTGNDKLLESYLLRASKQFPNDPRPLEYLLDIQERLGESDALKTTAKTLVPLLENKTKKDVKPKSLVYLGMAYWFAEDHAKSEQVFQRAMSLYSTDLWAFNTLAYLYADANDTQNLPKALTYANKALGMAQKQSQNLPEDTEAAILDTIAWVEYRQGDKSKALADMQSALAKAPRMAEGQYHLGMIYLAIPNPDREAAKGAFTRATYICPDYAAARAELEKLKDVSTPAGTPDKTAGSSTPESAITTQPASTTKPALPTTTAPAKPMAPASITAQ